jgi:hypothetical protein
LRHVRLFGNDSTARGASPDRGTTISQCETFSLPKCIHTALATRVRSVGEISDESVTGPGHLELKRVLAKSAAKLAESQIRACCKATESAEFVSRRKGSYVRFGSEADILALQNADTGHGDLQPTSEGPLPDSCIAQDPRRLMVSRSHWPPGLGAEPNLGRGELLGLVPTSLPIQQLTSLSSPRVPLGLWLQALRLNRTSKWRNQNQFEYSRRMLRK